MAASWNTELIEEVGAAIASEARAKHEAAQREGDHGMYKGLAFFAPNINLFRDPRWGRGHETYGEDPTLTARLGVAYIRGLQGPDPENLRATAWAKHFAVHSGPESQRMTFDARPSARDLHESYLPAFKAAVIEGRVASVMPAYNRIYNEPCCASSFLLRQLLREAWGFDGFVVSDGGAYDFVFKNHMVRKGSADTVADAMKAGCDLELGDVARVGGPAALEAGILVEADFDRALERTFTTLFRLGLIGAPSPHAGQSLSVVAGREHQALNLRIAEQSMVLLKNDHGILPLRQDLKEIAVCGPNADSREVLLGNYNGIPSSSITALHGSANSRQVKPISGLESVAT